MANRTELLIAKFIQYRSIYEYVGNAEVSGSELLEYIDSLRAMMARSDTEDKLTVDALEPFLVETKNNYYAMDFDAIGTVFHDFLINFLPGIFNHQKIRSIVQKYMPGKLVCDATEVELDKQSYKYLYETLKGKYNSLERDFHSPNTVYAAELAGITASVTEPAYR